MSLLKEQQDIRLIGQSEAMQRVEREIDCAAQSDAKVLITGDTGVGKELVARLIHQRSRRRAQGLVAINCSGLPDTLLESELFGHARGSFTGAYRDKLGLLDTVPNGTVFLDEVGEMSPRMQAVLLRFLESGEIQRVGAERPHRGANVRLIAATNRDLAAQMAGHAFREDLYFRLSVIQIRVPALRERIDDIPLLVSHYLGVFGRTHGIPDPEIAPEAMEALSALSWPGNIRQLKNVVERLVLHTRGREIRARDLAEDQSTTERQPSSVPSTRAQAEDRPARLLNAMVVNGESFWSAVYPLFMARDLTREELRRIIRAGLEATHGNYRLLVERFNMPPEDYKRFLGFLRQYDCNLSFHLFRTTRPVPYDLPATGTTSGRPAPVESRFFQPTGQ